MQVVLFASSVLLPESTVSVVNSVAISEDELDREVGKLLPGAYYHASVDEEKLNDLKEKALKSLIEKNLFYQYALSKNIDISDEEVEKILKTLEEYYGSKNVLKSALVKLNHTYETFKIAIKKR